MTNANNAVITGKLREVPGEELVSREWEGKTAVVKPLKRLPFDLSWRMRSYTMLKIKMLALFISLLCTAGFAQNPKVVIPDLVKLVKENKITAYNRNVTANAEGKNGIHLDANNGYGVAWLNGIHFGKGSLEFDVKGKNAMQQSFVGIAFHGLDDHTMDVVYFRPFNFQARDMERKNHSVQYVSLPAYDWQKLRADFPGKYEHSLNPSPDPDEWFHVRVVINTPEIRVYVNNNSSPDLVVEQLGDPKDGNVGFWVRNQSNGDLANLKIASQ
jgi:hypothetical protein